MFQLVGRWIDSANNPTAIHPDGDGDAIDWSRIVPFIVLHLACALVFWVGSSSTAIWVALASYLVRMFAITAFFHRYFSHRAFKTGRITQFVFALVGTAATQRGPLWWAAHHRAHHRHTDTEKDPHDSGRGFFWSHMGWFLSKQRFNTPEKAVSDLVKFPELKWLNRFDVIAPLLLIVLLYLGGELLRIFGVDTNGWQLVVWGYFISTVALIHATLMINSLAHRSGRRRFNTGDNSRNNLLLALVTLGEGWHNNHHRCASAARQGFYWWEIDLSYYGLLVLERIGLVWDLKPVPARILSEGRRCA